MQHSQLLEKESLHHEDFAQWEAVMADVIDVQDLEFDFLLQKRANSLIGSIAVQNSFEVSEITQAQKSKPENLADALELARNGDEQAKLMIKTNVTTDYFERAHKSGFVSEIKLEKDENGEIIQFGQRLEDVHLNSLRFISNEKLRQRAKIETLNSVRDKYYSEQGLLKNNARVTFSMVHEEMDECEAESVGFFTQTRSVSIQILTEDESGKLVMQTAFVAGRENLDRESFDKQAVIRLAEKLGIDYKGLTTEEILARPILVNKSLIPDLALSLVEQYDEAAAEVTEKNKFFGLDADTKNNHDSYLLKESQSRILTDKMAQDIEAVVTELMKYKTSSPIEATNQLSKLNDQLLKQRIICDETIDARVLGVQAAWYVNHARALLNTDEISQQMLQREMRILQRNITEKGQSSSCPSGGSTSNGNEKFDLLGDLIDNQSDDDMDSTPEDCEFISKECPMCGDKNVKTVCKDGVYYGSCGCSSDGGGKAKSKQFALAA